MIAASNYLVQLPVDILGFKNTWGAFTFPFIFLTTDLTVRIFGAPLARKIIFFTMLPALIISYAIGVIFYDGNYVGITALNDFNSVVFRIALASFMAYLIGQLLDITVFNRLRQLKSWWIAPSASTLVGNAIDTLIFFSVAFYSGADEYMAAHWVEIGMADYTWKLIICGLFFLPAYGVLLAILTKKLTQLQVDKQLNMTLPTYSTTEIK
ncbi:Inner membrane protein yhhQ [Suttonella ornithocola]|uniref:Probable queuosine precursor transporter n=1 Tax=Suttonella ornithocola TaxID=279832 RepID=A0A380MS14_9GAMM|nr:7-cyano-7-deazaguanine/7-aminomethyl-7-deazaguanine transporter [Suttonella ornithocola]SUO94501.1 Inner membrane protein yhhQ [Suttonella ornithocola]